MADTAPPTPSFSVSRRWAIGLNVALAMAAALALVVMANYLASRHFRRFQWTRDNSNQLSPLTLGLLQTLTNQIEVVVFFDRESPVYSSVSALLKEYELACPRLHIRYVDYIQNPGAAQLLKDRYKTILPGDEFTKNLVLFDNGNARRIVFEKDLSGLDISGLLAGKTREIKRTKFNGEQMFTSALVSVTEAKRPKAYFLAGHRELDPQAEDAHGGSKLALLLQQLNIETSTLLLGGTNVPSDCNLLVIAGPQNEFEPRELDEIGRYLDQGGRLFLLLNNIGRSGLEQVLAKWGVRVGDDNIIAEAQSKSGSKSGETFDYTVTTTNFPAPGHPITQPLLRSRLQFVLPRSVCPLGSSRSDPDSTRVTEIVASDEASVASRVSRDGNVAPGERRGSLPIVVTVEKGGGVPGISTERGGTRMVIAGDSVFLSNGVFDYLANSDFAGLAVNWLLDRNQLMGGIAPRAVKEYRLVMTHAQILAVRWTMLVALPGGVLLLGLLVWSQRRS